MLNDYHKNNIIDTSKNLWVQFISQKLDNYLKVYLYLYEIDCTDICKCIIRNVLWRNLQFSPFIGHNLRL